MRGAVGAVLLALACGPAGAEAPALPRLGPAPNFALTTQQNDRLWLTQLRDRLVVLTFTCTTCEACPGFLPALSRLSRALGEAAGRRVFFVAVSVDPDLDTPAVLRQFARHRDLAPPVWILLTGKPSEVNVVTRWYGAEVQRDDGRIAHRCAVTLIDGVGVIRGRYAAEDIGRLRAGIATLLAE